MEIDHIAKLARIELTEKERGLFSQQVGDIIKYIDKLNELDTSTVEPTAHVLPMKNIFRDDKLTPSLPKEKVLQNAPSRKDDFYRVPKIIE
jgi:aspartyl-tRNA(Asn)/glutamyl-tRNA(Gln) amidotransferase subunit C